MSNGGSLSGAAALPLPIYQRHSRAINYFVIASILLVLGVFIWQAVTAAGNPDPKALGVSSASAVVDTGVLVFREGLEAILVLSALTASLVRTEPKHLKPVVIGTALSFIATVITWFIVVALISAISGADSNPQRALDIQAGTGLLAIGVLLVVMNWFFHKFYWTGWITMHNRRKKNLTGVNSRTSSAVFRGLVLLGFTSVYREGFEVVLFLQSLRLKFGMGAILTGVSIGLFLTALVGVIIFVLHYRLPYKKMLVVTGIMLGGVLLVMVGENVLEMQQAQWISATAVAFRGHTLVMPDWMNLWFGVFPTWESLASQAFAGAFVIGSYFLARKVCASASKTNPSATAACILPDCDNCSVAGEKAGQTVQLTVRPSADRLDARH